MLMRNKNLINKITYLMLPFSLKPISNILNGTCKSKMAAKKPTPNVRYTDCVRKKLYDGNFVPSKEMKYLPGSI